MKERQSDAQLRREFFTEMGERFGDEVLSVEMVCLEADNDVFAALELKPVQKEIGLWGLLVLCKKSLHFYAHPTESPLLGLFRAASNRKPPAEQTLSFNKFTNFNIRSVEKKTLFGTSREKYLIAIDAELSAGESLGFYFRTQNKAAAVLEKLAALEPAWNIKVL